MPSYRRILLAVLVGGMVVSPLVSPAARASEPRATATAPIKNFRLPTFTTQGFRQTMIRAAEARLPSPERIEAFELELTLFTGDASDEIEVMLAAPRAILFPEKQLASGPDSVRLERIDLTVTGADWSYDHLAKEIVINRDAHVVMRATLGDILK
ncbi:MAG: hypothetical protein EAZ36_00270 [Verrucomicrobia bacterium]|nr:MAG: hypothetical protein EAZ36_00270 [Verrucomicrobiota bacterium]